MQLGHATRDRVDVYGPALLDTETLAGSFSDQETGVRGFLAGGRDSFLAPYVDGRATERQTVRHLRGLLADRPDLLAKVDAVEAAGRTWRREVAEPAIARVRADGVSQQQPFSDVEAGLATFDAIRTAVADLRQPVQASRTEAQAALTRSRHRLDVILLVALIGVAVLAVGDASWVALRRWVTRPLGRLGSEVDLVEARRPDPPCRGRRATHPARSPSSPSRSTGCGRGSCRSTPSPRRPGPTATEARALVEEQAEDLRRSNTELEQFAYVASHDLQEPLRKVASFCQLIERRYKGQLDERGEQYIEFAVDGAKRMQQLINDLLTFSRVGRRSTGFARRSTSSRCWLRPCASSTPRWRSPTPSSRTTRCRRWRATRACWCSCSRTWSATRVKFRGDDPPRVHIVGEPARRRRGCGSSRARDNGIGIEPQYADKIFVIFQRLHGRDAYGAPASAWPCARRSSSTTAVGSGWTPRRATRRGRCSAGRCRNDRLSRSTAYDEPEPETDETERTSHDATVRG